MYWLVHSFVAGMFWICARRLLFLPELNMAVFAHLIQSPGHIEELCRIFRESTENLRICVDRALHLLCAEGAGVLFAVELLTRSDRTAPVGVRSNEVSGSVEC
jgi:hypothetical protein